MIKDIFIFANGNTACCNERGEQISEEQTNVVFDYLADKIKRGVVSKDTEVNVQSPLGGGGYDNITIANLIYESAFFFPAYKAMCEKLGVIPRSLE